MPQNPLIDMATKIGELTGELKGLREFQENRFDGIQKQISDQFVIMNNHQVSINNLERITGKISMGIMMAGAIGGGIFTLIVTFGKDIFNWFINSGQTPQK